MPQGFTNGVPCFQRNIDSFISRHKLSGTFAYLDNLTVCGKDSDDHDKNLTKFHAAAGADNLKFNCSFNTIKVQLLGYEVSNNEIRPGPSRLQPLRYLPPPKNAILKKKGSWFICLLFKMDTEFLREDEATCK